MARSAAPYPADPDQVFAFSFHQHDGDSFTGNAGQHRAGTSIDGRRPGVSSIAFTAEANVNERLAEEIHSSCERLSWRQRNPRLQRNRASGECAVTPAPQAFGTELRGLACRFRPLRLKQRVRVIGTSLSLLIPKIINWSSLTVGSSVSRYPFLYTLIIP